jgi:hypothetical protein
VHTITSVNIINKTIQSIAVEQVKIIINTHIQTYQVERLKYFTMENHIMMYNSAYSIKTMFTIWTAHFAIDKY